MSEYISLNNENNSVLLAEDNYSNMNFIQRVLGVIISPEKTMKSLEQKPRILFSLLLTLITPIVMIFSIFPMFIEYTRKTLEATYENMNIQMTSEQIDQVLNITKYTAPFAGAIGAVAMWFLGTLVLWGIIKIFKGEGQYKQILSVTGYASVISTLAVIVSIVTTQLTGAFSDVSYTSFASLLPNMKGNFFYGASKAIDVFSIWKYIVIAIGVTTVSKLEKKKVYIIIACIFAVFMIYTGVAEVRAAGLM